MRKQSGCLSPSAILATLLALAIIGVYTYQNGAVLFSPGALTAAASLKVEREGYRSHAEFEDQCTRCHEAWRGVDASRCVTCHTNVTGQIMGASGLHGHLENPGMCVVCHTEHQGRTANITAAALEDFPHQQVGFSLVLHRQTPDGGQFACDGCHLVPDYAFDTTSCETCHLELDAAFVMQHVSDYGRNCLGCHDGSGAMESFDHDTFFPLDGAHAPLACDDCHVDHMYQGTPSECVACHAEPDVHRGLFGTDCAACHTAQAWIPARLLQHTFPLNHGSSAGTETACEVCHAANYVTYTCYDCHDHDPDQIRREHLEEGLQDFENCVECHPTGQEDE
jgi:hypothetical protein